MNCHSCQTPNPENAHFCLNCGAALPQTCPGCGAPNPAGARFCSQCGSRLEARRASPPVEVQPVDPAEAPVAPPQARLQQFIPKELLARLESAGAGMALAGERRVVTMLFCDVEGSTAAAGRLDPEEWAEVINGAFERMIRPVYQYEGTVARLMGDGLLAFFGAPLAHEDDPQRAVLAGLAIVAALGEYSQAVRRQWGVAVNARVGINTGLVVVGAVGSDLRMEYTALGDAINLAARMEQTARPGTVQVAEPTYHLIAPLFDFETIEALQVKGKDGPLRAYRVLGLRAEPGSLRGIAGLDAPLIGRASQLAALQAAVSGVRAGRGALAAIIGEAGLGKSRLLAELRHSAQMDGSGLRWVEGRVHSYETHTPYALFTDLLAGLLDLPDGREDGEQYAALKSQLETLLPGRAGELAPFIGTLMGISPTGPDLERVKYLEPPFLRGQITAQMMAMVENLAAQGPLVLVFDDVHWIDPTSAELLQSLLAVTGRAPVLILAAFRPRRDEPSWQLHESAQRAYPDRYTAITLEPLSEAESGNLLGSLLHIDGLPDQVRKLILERADGNPLFVEELIRSLLDAGLIVRAGERWQATAEIKNLALPDTLVGVITARLDRLAEPDRQAAQSAAVIGRDFEQEILADLYQKPAALGPALAALQARELIREKTSAPEQAYRFKHVLTQEAAYASILLSRRRELHRRAGESLETHHPEQAADIARHFLEARLPARAAPHLVAAGDRAARAYASAEAIAAYTQALEQRSAIPDLQLIRRAFEGLGSTLAFANQLPEAVKNYEAMLALGEEHSDIPMQVSALTKVAAVLALRMGQFPQAETILARAENLARAYDVHSGIAEMAIVRCQMCTAVADFDNVVRHMGEVIEIGHRLASKEHLAMGMEHVSSSLMFLTRFEEAWETAQQALKVAREIEDREHEAWILTTTVPVCLVCRGELEAASREIETGLEIAGRIGALPPQIYGNWLRGEIARWQGKYERALEYGQRSLQTSLPVEAYMPFMTVQPLGSLGTTYLEISGHFTDQVARFHQHALRLLETPAGVAGGGTAWVDLGHCALTIGDLETAENSFQKGLSYPTMFMLVEKPRYLEGMAQVALARGQLEQAQKYNGEARRYAEARGMAHVLPIITLGSGQIQAARGETAAALESFEEAERRALDLKFRPVVWKARAGAAGVLERAGRLPEAQSRRQAAQAMIAEIGGLFTGDTLRAAFLAHALPAAGHARP